jgi:hypothetical protein
MSSLVRKMDAPVERNKKNLSVVAKRGDPDELG